MKRIIEQHRAGGTPVEKSLRSRNYDEVADLVAKRVEETSGRISAKRLLPAATAAGYVGSRARSPPRPGPPKPAPWGRERRPPADPAVAAVEPNYIVRSTAVPNDPSFSSLYALQNTGQTVGGRRAHRARTSRRPKPGTSRPGRGRSSSPRPTAGSTNPPRPRREHLVQPRRRLGLRGGHARGQRDHRRLRPRRRQRLRHPRGGHPRRGRRQRHRRDRGELADLHHGAEVPRRPGHRVHRRRHHRDRAGRAGQASRGRRAGDQRVLGRDRECHGAARPGCDNGRVRAAAGNNAANNDTTPSYPAACNLPTIISVAATDNRDQLRRSATTARPASTWPRPGWPSAAPCRAGPTATSTVTPQVSGAAALVLSAEPTLTTAQLEARLLGAVDPVPALAGRTVTGGRLDVCRAVTGCASAARRRCP